MSETRWLSLTRYVGSCSGTHAAILGMTYAWGRKNWALLLEPSGGVTNNLAHSTRRYTRVKRLLFLA